VPPELASEQVPQRTGTVLLPASVLRLELDLLTQDLTMLQWPKAQRRKAGQQKPKPQEL
jgi:hypothetical protein